KTNLPNPPARQQTNADFQFSIGTFKIIDGDAFVNERRIKIDFALNHVNSDLSYETVNRILSMQVAYDGSLQLENKVTIPYTLSAKLDYTRGTVVAQRIDVKSGKSAITLQGRINDVLAKSIAGRLEYKGTGAVPFLNHFFPKESFGGSSDLAGVLEF